MRRPLALAVAGGVILLVLAACPTGLLSWSNGPAGNATTNEASECATPSYATHDWIADHARDLLPPTGKGAAVEFLDIEPGDQA